jgi:hypothetical protein
MADRAFIHAAADVSSTLAFALDSGLCVIDAGMEQSKPFPNKLERTDVAQRQKGVFYLFSPEWVFGPFQFDQIQEGYYRGNFSIQPRVNFAAVTVYFQGERMDQGQRRFGDCLVSSHRHWLEVPGNVVRPEPPDVDEWFKCIAAHLASGIAIKAGVHRYGVTKGVLADPNRNEALPPFDFIPWPIESGRDK